MDKTKLLKCIGLAARARKIIFGAELTCDGVREKDTELVILSSEASEGTKKRVVRACTENDVECHIIDASVVDLASAVGKSKPLAVIGITDKNLCVPVRQNILGLTEKQASSQKLDESEVIRNADKSSKI